MGLYCLPLTNSLILCSITFGTAHHSLAFHSFCSWLSQHTFPGSGWGDWTHEGATLQNRKRGRKAWEGNGHPPAASDRLRTLPHLPTKLLLIWSLPCDLLYCSTYHPIVYPSSNHHNCQHIAALSHKILIFTSTPWSRNCLQPPCMDEEMGIMKLNNLPKAILRVSLRDR